MLCAPSVVLVSLFRVSVGNHLASRIESATKSPGVPVLLSETVRARLPGSVATRRLGRARVSGVDEDVDLHALVMPGSSADWTALREAHERLLAHFESGSFEKARSALAEARGMPLAVDDRPLGLLGQAVEQTLDGEAVGGLAFDLSVKPT